MSKWFCEQCGKENDGDFCIECGRSKPKMIDPKTIADKKESKMSSENNADDVTEYTVENSKSQSSIGGIALVAVIIVLGFQFVDEQFLTNVKSMIEPESKVAVVSENPQTEEHTAPKKRASTFSDNEVNSTINVQEQPQKQPSTEQQNLSQVQPEASVVHPTNNVSATPNTKVVATYYVVNCNEWITLRSEPSTYASSLAHIPLGQAVGYIEEAGNGFYKINYDGLVGYGLSDYLSSNKPSRPAYRQAQVVNCKEWITLRSHPSTSAASLARIPLGAYVTYINESTDGFYYIEYNGMRGYSLQAYLELR